VKYVTPEPRGRVEWSMLISRVFGHRSVEEGTITGYSGAGRCLHGLQGSLSIKEETSEWFVILIEGHSYDSGSRWRSAGALQILRCGEGD